MHMSIISLSMLVFVIFALLFTYWSIIRPLVNRLQLHWLPFTLIIVFFMGLSSILIFIISQLLMAGTINAGTLLGMFFGITLILGTIRTFNAR